MLHYIDCILMKYILVVILLDDNTLSQPHTCWLRPNWIALPIYIKHLLFTSEWLVYYACWFPIASCCIFSTSKHFPLLFFHLHFSPIANYFPKHGMESDRNERKLLRIVDTACPLDAAFSRNSVYFCYFFFLPSFAPHSLYYSLFLVLREGKFLRQWAP